MADLLVLNKPHWMDKLTQEQVDAYAAKDPNFMRSYLGRYQPGDVVEVGPDGRWKDHQTGRGKFAIVRCPGMSVEAARKYLESSMVDDEVDEKTGEMVAKERPEIEYRRKYKIDLSKMTARKERVFEAADVKTVEVDKLAISRQAVK